jgi:hypothetical protein
MATEVCRHPCLGSGQYDLSFDIVWIEELLRKHTVAPLKVPNWPDRIYYLDIKEIRRLEVSAALPSFILTTSMEYWTT